MTAVPSVATSTSPAAGAEALIYAYAIMTPQQFINALKTLSKECAIPAVVTQREEGLMHKKRVWYYAAALKGIIAITRTEHPLQLPDNTAVIEAVKITLPQAVKLELSRLKEGTPGEG